VVYNDAGYNNKYPAQAVAKEIQKPHIKAHLLRLNPAFYHKKEEYDGSMTEAEWAYEQLKKFAPDNAQAAYNFVEYHRKRSQEGGGVDVVAVLLSSFLSEEQLDEYRDNIPQDVVVATVHKKPDVGESQSEVAETPVNIEVTV